MPVKPGNKPKSGKQNETFLGFVYVGHPKTIDFSIIF